MNRVSRFRVELTLCAALAAASAHAQTPTVRGYWRDPSGAVIRIAPCSRSLCVQLVALPAGSHPETDIHNPDSNLRGRALCDLRIGEGFVQLDPGHASGGRIYDPRTGRTYRASMTAEGNRLELRGYIGLSLFGRTETWLRKRKESAPCRGK